MPQSMSQTVRTQFNKGLLTEFSELNFPDEASIDELNCDLKKAGNRTKRLGISYEPDYETLSGAFGDGRLFHTGVWTNVGGNAALEYVVMQSGNKLRFYQKGGVPLSAQIVPSADGLTDTYTLDLSLYSVPGGAGAGSSKVSMASINGDLIVVSPNIEAIQVSRDPDDGTFTVTEISFRIRDYEWQGNRSLYSEDSFNAPAGINRQYDTKNTGWADGANDIGDTVLASYVAFTGGYWPPLTHPWYSGKNSNGDFNIDLWRKVYSGTSIIGNGHYILDLFYRDREAVSGLTGIETEVIEDRFTTVASYAGRAWYAGFDSRVYYSQILESNNQLGDCFRVNDPTSEEASDALDTDGGYINLAEASGIRALHVFGSSLLVFADNGVWRISGIDGNLFKATDFSVYKITDFGLAFKSSLVAGQNAVPFWWSYAGIHTIQVTEQGGMVEVNLTRDTIQTFWNSIGSSERSFVTGSYDAFNNRILWLYPNNGETVDYKLNNILFLDADLGAFFPWKISDKGSRYVCGAAYLGGNGSEDVVFNVVDEDGDQVVDGSGNEVVVTQSAGTVRSSEIYFLTRTTSGEMTWSTFHATSYYDWGDVNYEAYAESAYNFVADLSRKKNSPYIVTFMKQTETGFVFDAGSGGYLPLNESSLKVSAYWDFKKQASSAPQQAYRHKLTPVVDLGDLDNFPSPTEVLTSRLKLRGRGRVVRLRFEGEEGKAFNLLGWETLDATNPTY